MEEKHASDLIINHTEKLTRLLEQDSSICRKIEQLEKFLEEKIKQRDEELKLSRDVLDKRFERVEDIIKRVTILEINYSQRSGSKRWEDHIITVLIGAAVVIVVWLMQHGIE